MFIAKQNIFTRQKIKAKLVCSCDDCIYIKSREFVVIYRLQYGRVKQSHRNQAVVKMANFFEENNIYKRVDPSPGEKQSRTEIPKKRKIFEISFPLIFFFNLPP